MPWNFLETKQAVLIYLYSVYYRTSLRGASQNKIDDDGEQQNKMEKNAKGEGCNQASKIVLFSLRRILKRA